MVNKSSNIRAVITSHGRGEIFLNGEKVAGVRKIEISCGVDEINEVRLTLNVDAIEVDGEFDVTSIDDVCRVVKGYPSRA